MTSHNRISSPDRSSFYDSFPKEVINEIALRTPLEEIGPLCYADARFKEKCKNRFFWINYLRHRGIDTDYDDPQDRLHHLFIELAKQGDWELFEFLWNNDLELIKENRSLGKSYEAAYKNGKKKVADRIASLGPIWNLRLFPYWTRHWIIVSKWEVGMLFDLEVAVEKNNLSTLNSLSDPNLKNRLYYLLSLSNSLKFIKRFWQFRPAEWDDVLINLLIKGKFHMVDELIDFWEIDEERQEDITWIDTLQSPNDDSFDYIHGRFRDAPDELTPEFIREYNGGVGMSIGSPTLLREYAQQHPDDHETILLSFRTLRPKRFYQLYKSTAKCYNEIERKDFLEDLRAYGYDYLYALFEKGVPICE